MKSIDKSKFVKEFTLKDSSELKSLPKDARKFAKEIIEPIMHLKGDSISVSEMPLDGAVPVGTMKIEKRGKTLVVRILYLELRGNIYCTNFQISENRK